MFVHEDIKNKNNEKNHTIMQKSIENERQMLYNYFVYLYSEVKHDRKNSMRN